MDAEAEDREGGAPGPDAQAGLDLLSLAGLVVAVLAIAVLVSQHALIAAGWVAGTIQVLAAVLMMWARITFGLRSFHAAANPTAGGVVTSGPYAFLRHPIYAAILWFVWAGALTHASPLVIGAALVITAGTAVRIAMEERLLRGRYPEYADYARRVRRVIPFVL